MELQLTSTFTIIIVCICTFLGKALKFVREKVLTVENGMRRAVPKVLVVVTDGRSQDDVKKYAMDIQHSGKHAAHPRFLAAEIKKNRFLSFTQ